MEDDMLVASMSSMLSPNIDDDDCQTPFPPLDSPSASMFLRTAETLDGLANQLENLKDGGDPSREIRCTCGAMVEERERMEDQLKLSGGGFRSPFSFIMCVFKIAYGTEIGSALLQRYEALEKKYQREIERYEYQVMPHQHD